MHKLILISVVATAVIVAGCGGSSDRTLTKNQVIARGTVICKTAEKRVEKLPQLTVQHPFAKGTSAATHATARRFLAGYADALEYSRAGLSTLAAPKDGKQLLDGYLTDLSRIVTQFRVAAKAPDAQVEGAAQKAFGMFDQASSQTKRYGFPKGVCASGSS
ncbi:MAG TPA: hypothetical protein VH300_12435 [Thermoleophilaceae bacterium]|nr:hypothetical protein [Thermoleophilaceae bacterium]